MVCIRHGAISNRKSLIVSRWRAPRLGAACRMKSLTRNLESIEVTTAAASDARPPPLLPVAHTATDFGRVWLLTPCTLTAYCLRMTKTEYLTEYDGIVKTVQMYIDGSKQGKSSLMRPAFHPDASFFGYAGEQLASRTQLLFDWIDK